MADYVWQSRWNTRHRHVATGPIVSIQINFACRARINQIQRGCTMAILSTLLVGLIVGAIAKLDAGKDPGGFIITILLGIAGALVGHGSASSSLGQDYARAGSCRSSAPWSCCCCIDSFLNAGRRRVHRAFCSGGRRRAPILSSLIRRSPRRTPLQQTRAFALRGERDIVISQWPSQRKRSLSSRLPRCT